jgi:uncharacterized protein
VPSIVTRFKVDEIGEEAQHLALRPPGAWIDGLDLRVEGKIETPIRIDLDMRRSGGEVFVDGRLEGRCEFPCYRCLEPATAPFSADFHAAYLPLRRTGIAARGTGGAAVEHDEEDLEPESGDEDIYDQADGEVDLLPMLREQILVALPDRALCREGCKGLCASCGANLNTTACGCAAQEDFSRFGKLRDLRIR